MIITLTRYDGGLHVHPATPYIRTALTYSHRSSEVRNYKREDVFTRKELFELDGQGGLCTLQGFFRRLETVVAKHHDQAAVVDTREKIPQPNWEVAKTWIGKLRDYQVEPYVDLLVKSQTDSGLCVCTGGFGKSFAMQFLYASYHHMNTIVAVPYKQVFKQLYKQFKEAFPDKDIGLYGDGSTKIGQDITITTYASLKNCALEKCELLLADEVQCCTGEEKQQVFGSIQPVRAFGFTATDKNFFNGAEKLLVGLFGERLVYIDYQEAEKVGAVVKGYVYMIRVPADAASINARDARDAINKGIQKSSYRNKLVGRTCAAIPKELQTLVFVDIVNDHLIPLHGEMPAGTRFVHRNGSKKELGAYACSNKQQTQTIEAFANNEFQFLIATDALRAGADFQNCRVVVQASGGSSEVEILQEAYRGSRILTEEKQKELGVGPKTHFVLIDFFDEHHESLQGMSFARQRIYKKEGWEVKVIDSVDQIPWERH